MIEIYVDGRNFGKHGTAWAIILTDGKHLWESSFDCGNVTTNMAALQAMQYVLKSIKREHRQNVNIIIDNRYIQTMLEKDKNGHWEKNPQINASLVEAVRKSFDGYKNAKILLESESPFYGKVKKLTEMAVKEKKYVCNRS